MKLLDRLERTFGQYTITNLTYYLIIGQVLTYLTVLAYPHYTTLFTLNGNLVLLGQWWRLFSFLFQPVSENLIFVVLVWFFMYTCGTALERQWGEFRYLIYLLVIYFATVIAAFLFPSESFGNGYLFASVFLGFAYLYPDYRLYIFFIIPVKVKWIAALIWLGIILSLLFGSLATKVLTVLSISNFLLFFGKDILLTVRYRSRKARQITTKTITTQQAHHVCAVCKKNEVNNPNMEIRYCSQCIPSTCYCGDHIKNHVHKREKH